MKQLVRVWDLPTRLFHWSLVNGLILMYLTAITGQMRWHIVIGLFLFGLMIFRILWGFLGSQSAHFKNFIKGQKDIKRYLKGHLSENEQPGHNPLAAIMVVVLMGLVSLQIISGLLATNLKTRFGGHLIQLIPESIAPFAQTMHGVLFWILFGFSVLHIVAIILHGLVKKNNLITPMITGYKKIEGATSELKFAPRGLALVLSIATVAGVYLLLYV